MKSQVPPVAIAFAAALFAASATASTAQASRVPERTAPAPRIACALSAPDGSPRRAETVVRPFDLSAPGALTVDQMSAAWAHEIARIFPELGGGGG